VTTAIALPHAKRTLANGLDVIVHEDRRVPIVAVNLWYHVGSKNERSGRTGFAHLFEHLMFEGSEHYNKGYFFPLQQAGALLNGSTNSDRTNYWEVVPTTSLELALWMESDRMGYLLPALTPERFETQRGVVLNERRQNYENRPYGMALMAISAALYPPDHPYHWLTIGAADDLEAMEFEDVRAFGIDVARQRQRRVRRVVVRPEKRTHVFELHRTQVVGGADRQPVIRMVGRVKRGTDRHQRHSVRAILVILPPLVEHHATLGLETLGRQRREQIPHPVGFHPERQLQRGGGDDFPIVRAIAVRGAVEQRASLLQRKEISLVVVFGSLEHQVLEQMRETGATAPLVLRSDVVPQVDGYDRHPAILVDDDVEAVGERPFLVRKSDGGGHASSANRNEWNLPFVCFRALVRED
jgi:hypothetical protein